jgi:superoxide reductase
MIGSWKKVPVPDRTGRNHSNRERQMSSEKGEVYKCDVCGAVVEVKEGGGGELVCCDQPMERQ